MRVLVLNPGRALEFCYFEPGYALAIRGEVDVGDATASAPGQAALKAVRRQCVENGVALSPELIALHGLFGGPAIEAPALADAKATAALDRLIELAPLHVPRLVAVRKGCAHVFPEVPVAVVSETAFFESLPDRERLYGLSARVAEELNMYRRGFHGIFHEAACRHAATRVVGARKVISVCLESKPEVAGVRDLRPLMVTSGATFLEGLPGHTLCGDLDPSIVLELGTALTWGQERINRVLTEESGFLGLTGRPVSLDALFREEDASLRLAREILIYRCLTACGAAAAAMGGVDAILFSGQYSFLSRTLGPWLAEHLPFYDGARRIEIPWAELSKPIERLVAEAAVAAVQQRAGA